MVSGKENYLYPQSRFIQQSLTQLTTLTSISGPLLQPWWVIILLLGRKVSSNRGILLTRRHGLGAALCIQVCAEWITDPPSSISFGPFSTAVPWASRAPLTSVSALRRNGDEGVCFFFYLFSVAYLPLFGNLRLTGTEEREEKTCSKGSGLESNPGGCSKDSALVHGANAPPTGCQDDCFWMLAEENTDESE